MAHSPCVLVLSSLLHETNSPHAGLTMGGWIFMTGSLAAVLGLVYFCYSRLLRDVDTDRARSQGAGDRED